MTNKLPVMKNWVYIFGLLMVLLPVVRGGAHVFIGFGKCRRTNCYGNCWGHSWAATVYCGYDLTWCQQRCTAANHCRGISWAPAPATPPNHCHRVGLCFVYKGGNHAIGGVQTYWRWRRSQSGRRLCFARATRNNFGGPRQPCVGRTSANTCTGRANGFLVTGSYTSGDAVGGSHVAVRPAGSCKCKCNPGYSGTRCERTPCHGKTRNNYCRTRGVPTVVGTPFRFAAQRCECRRCSGGYTGTRCERPPCYGKTTRNFCNNHGHPIVSGSQCVCSCTHGYTGSRCERSPCYSRTRNNFCNSRGTPIINGSTCTCRRCSNGYTGARCERSPCWRRSSGNLCYSRGTPYVTGSTCKCRSCRNGYTGNFCEKNPCYGRTYHNWCNSRGFPSVSGSACTCFHCRNGYRGRRCELGGPTAAPTGHPSQAPTNAPTLAPTTSAPTRPPTSSSPSISPTGSPTIAPTSPPSSPPSTNPTQSPTKSPIHPLHGKLLHEERRQTASQEFPLSLVVVAALVLLCGINYVLISRRSNDWEANKDVADEEEGENAIALDVDTVFSVNDKIELTNRTSAVNQETGEPERLPSAYPATITYVSPARDSSGIPVGYGIEGTEGEHSVARDRRGNMKKIEG